jgi:hypothetical protein
MRWQIVYAPFLTNCKAKISQNAQIFKKKEKSHQNGLLSDKYSDFSLNYHLVYR